MYAIFGTISQVEALTSNIDTIWQAVLAVGIAMLGYRIGKRVIGKF